VGDFSQWIALVGMAGLLTRVLSRFWLFYHVEHRHAEIWAQFGVPHAIDLILIWPPFQFQLVSKIEKWVWITGPQSRTCGNCRWLSRAAYLADITCVSSFIVLFLYIQRY